MRLFVPLLLFISLLAHQPGGRGAVPLPAPKNLKLLAPDSDIPFVMRNFNEALGVQCTYFHAEGDFTSTKCRGELSKKNRKVPAVHWRLVLDYASVHQASFQSSGRMTGQPGAIPPTFS